MTCIHLLRSLQSGDRHDPSRHQTQGSVHSTKPPSSKSLATIPPVWFITGCSTGFGLALSRQAIEHGFRVVVTARDPAGMEIYAASDKVLVLELDVTQPDQIEAAMNAAEVRFGGIDVLVNNAGIGYFAAIEEGEEAEVRNMFEVNVFGMSRMIQAALAGMRERRRGVTVNCSSVGGLRAFPAIGYYNATKFVVEGLSEALWQEVEPLGIQVMLVEPSGFRTDWAGCSANESARQIDGSMAAAVTVRAAVRISSGKQACDPVLAAKAIIQAVGSGSPPHHLQLGTYAFDGAIAKLEDLRKDFSAGRGNGPRCGFSEDEHGCGSLSMYAPDRNGRHGRP